MHGRVHDYVSHARQLREGALTAREQLALVSEGTRVNLRAGDIRSQLPQLALSLRRLLGFAIQVRGLAGATDALFDRKQPAALEHAQLHELIDALLVQASAAMGPQGSPIILAGDAGALDSAEHAETIRSIASNVVAEFGDVSTVLESVAILGRFDYLRAQVQAYGTGDHIFEEEI